MDPKEIEQLLKAADRGPTGNASDPTVLADRVLKTLRRRRAARTVTTLLLLAGLVGVTMLNLPQPTPTSEIAILPKPQLRPRVEEELAAIRAEIAGRNRAVDELLAIEEGVRHKRLIQALQDDRAHSEALEHAAETIFLQADRLRDVPGLAHSAVDAYEDIMRHFPDTNWAELARQRITEAQRKG